MKLLGLIAAGMIVFVAPALAAPQDVANDVSQHVMSPYCPGVTLHDCPSDSAVALRERITEMAEAGATRAEIMAELEDEFGPTIRAEPAKSGSGLIAWVLPAVAVAAAIAIAWRVLRNWAAVPGRADASEPDDHITPADRRRLDAELDRLRGPA